MRHLPFPPPPRRCWPPALTHCPLEGAGSGDLAAKPSQPQEHGGLEAWRGVAERAEGAGLEVWEGGEGWAEQAEGERAGRVLSFYQG